MIAARPQVRRGQWQAPWSGVYADGGIELDLEQRAFAAVLASGGGPDRGLSPTPTGGGTTTPIDGATTNPAGDGATLRAVVCGRLAARLHGLPLIDDRDPATGAQEHLLDELAVLWGASRLQRRAADGQVRVLTRHRRRYQPNQVIRLPNGLYVTSHAQTVLDCAQLLTVEALVCLVDAALHRKHVTAAELDQLVQQRRWSPGAPRLRHAVAVADGRAESPNETLARLLLLPHLPGLVSQHRLYDEVGRILARFDLGDPGLRLAVEADGKADHAGPVMAARDQRRDRASDARGWRTERCTWFEVRWHQQSLVRRAFDAARAQKRRHLLT
jgi:hypothetical protein